MGTKRIFAAAALLAVCTITLLAGCVRSYDMQIFLTYSENTKAFISVSVPWNIRTDRSPSYSEQYGRNGEFISTEPFSEIVAALKAENPDVTFQKILDDRCLLTDTAGSMCMLKVEMIGETAGPGEEIPDYVFPNGLTEGECETDGSKSIRFYQLKSGCRVGDVSENFLCPLHLFTAEELGLIQHIAFGGAQPGSTYLAVGTQEDFQNFYSDFGLQPEPTENGFSVQCTGSGGSQLLVTFTFGTDENGDATVSFEAQAA